MSTVHVDLNHLGDVGPLMLEMHGTTVELIPHTSESRLAAAKVNPVLAAMPDSERLRFSHLADIDDEMLAGDEQSLRWLRVIKPAPEGVHLPEVILQAHYLPEPQLRAYAKRAMAMRHRPIRELRAFYRADMAAKPTTLSGKLAYLGITFFPTDLDEATQMLVESQKLITIIDTAAALTSHHPELASTDPRTATTVLYDHLLVDAQIDPIQFNAMKALHDAIARAGASWSPRVPCTDHRGRPLVAEYDLDGIKTGQQLFTYALDPDVESCAADVTSRARRTSSNDLSLANQTWRPSPGTATLVGTGAPSKPRVGASTGDSSVKWTVGENTAHHGISVDSGSISLKADGTFRIEASNTYLRTAYTGYRLLNDAGKPIGSTTKLRSISAVNSIMGIPCPTDPTALEFKLGDASSVELLFGSLGVTDWDGDVSLEGALLTCMFQYGVPIVFMAAGSAVTSTKLYNKILSDPDLIAAAIAIGIGIVGGAVPTAAALGNTKQVLTAFGNAVISFIFTKSMQLLGEFIAEKIAEGALSNSLGPVGWVMRLAATALNFVQMAVTTGECLSSPACITVGVSRAIDVSLVLAPDPLHGEVGDPKTAVWPAVATNYALTLQLKSGGTTRKLVGRLPTTTSHDLLPLLFEDVPAGGKLKIIAGVYSDNGWLAGTWESDWIDAVATKGTTLDLGQKEIKEKLVPLAGDTQYVFKERVAVSGDKFVWKADRAPTTTRTALDCAGTDSLCELVDVTINNSAQQIGYAWRASGQHLHPDDPAAPASDAQLFSVQNLSVLAEPSSRLKSTTVGFTDRPAIAYAPTTSDATRIDGSNFIIDPRGGGMHLRQVVLDDNKHDFGLGDPALPSWGHFPLENIDAAAVHPGRLVIACSWQQQKLLLLPLPAASGTDKAAPTALMVSGEGLRQGLVRGPKALAVAPDGRILVLESLNKRVQAFDLRGNPVPSFTPGPPITSLPTASIAAELDDHRVPPALQKALQQSGILECCRIPSSLATILDSGHFTPGDARKPGDALIWALAVEGVNLAYDRDAMSDPTLSAQIRVVDRGTSWTIHDPRGQQWNIEAGTDDLTVYSDIGNAQVQIQRAGQRWLVVDGYGGNAWQLAASSSSTTETEIHHALSYFPLRGMRTTEVTYMDMAVEAQGYVYVLSYQNDGSATTDYLLDVYGPDGHFVSRTPDPSATAHPANVVAGKFTVGLFRDLYGLTFETLRSPQGTAQPGIAHWTPTPPLFTLPLTSQQHFIEKNIGAVTNDFAEHKITLSSDAAIFTDSPNGAWSVRDGSTNYHVYRSGDGLQVYLVPA